VGIEVELDAFVLPDDLRIYKFFPGKAYKFYDLIRKQRIAIIDVRDLDELGDDPEEWDPDDVLLHITTDRIERAVAEGKPRPSRVVRSQGDKAVQTFITGLFFRAKKGDLILMPQKDYMSDVLIGQFRDEPGVLRKVTAKDDGGEHTYFGRRIAWVGSVEKRKLNATLVELLQTPTAFFDVGRSHYDDVAKIAFDNFVYDKQFVATFRTNKNIFTPKDNFLTSVWLELLEVLEEARMRGADLPAGSIYELVILSNIDEDERDDLSISVQSPGWFRIRSTVAAPLASLALFAMAAAGVPYDDAVAVSVSAQVVREADDTCMGDVDASVKDYIRLLGKDRWEQACMLAKQAESEAKLKADARVTPAARREED
jgi:hypothetical protein